MKISVLFLIMELTAEAFLSAPKPSIPLLTHRYLTKDGNDNLSIRVDRRQLFQATLALALGCPSLAQALENFENKRINVFDKVAPSVVFLDTFAERRDAFSPNVLEVPLGSGSGIVWDKEGHIVTNFHVIRNAQSAQVAILTRSTNKKGAVFDDNTLNLSPYTSMRPTSGPVAEGQTRSIFKATVVGVDPSKDIAVLKVDAPSSLLFPIPVGSSKELRVGQETLAIGNPFGLDHTLTSGVLSGVGRQVRSPIGRPITNVIQTDAAVNPGNSGGPLLDSSGKMIGMNAAIFSPSGASAGIGFAIPVDTVKFIVETLIRDGQVVRPILGISYLESSQAIALGINSGVLVLDVPPDSPPALAGLRGTRRTESGLIEVGDIITKVDDKKIITENDLFAALEAKKPGEIVKVTVNRFAAKNDALVVEELTLEIPLQPSTNLEKKYQFTPAP